MSVTMAARAHSGASLSAPVRRAQPVRRKTSWLGRVARVAGKRPGRALVLLAFGIVSLAIVANALMLQKARHPAPMLSATPVSQPRAAVERRAEPAPAPAVEAPAAQPVRPPARPNDLSQAPQAREAQPRPPAPVQAASRAAAPAPAPRAAAPARDPIADLINGGDLRPPADVRAASRSAAAPRN
jgi:hypothetical protein